MKNTSILLIVFLFAASVGRAQVVLPSSSEYHDPYNYYRDCVSSNGDAAQEVCERQTSSLFPEEEAPKESASENRDDLASYNPAE